MCGIVGAVAERNVTAILLEGLKRLEYRGYDSAGLAVINNSNIIRERRSGKVRELAQAAGQNKVYGHVGIAHTRWATHGAPTQDNAHPHVSGDIAVVHNGIIENYEELRHELINQGYQFVSQTDTEVVAHLVHRELQHTHDLFAAVKASVRYLKGAYALGIIRASEPARLIAVRKGSPLVIGLGIG